MILEMQWDLLDASYPILVRVLEPWVTTDGRRGSSVQVIYHGPDGRLRSIFAHGDNHQQAVYAAVAMLARALRAR